MRWTIWYVLPFISPFFIGADPPCQHTQIEIRLAQKVCFLHSPTLIMQLANSYHPCFFACSYPGCGKSCHTCSGLKQHGRTHRGCVACIPALQNQLELLGLQPEDDDDQNSNFSGPNKERGCRQVWYHPVLNGKLSLLLLFCQQITMFFRYFLQLSRE